MVQELLKRNADVSVLTRDAKKPLPAGAKAVEGNLLEVDSVRQVFNGVDAVFLLNPVSQTETSEALMAVTAMRTAGVKRVVYVSVHHVDRRTVAAALRIEDRRRGSDQEVGHRVHHPAAEQLLPERLLVQGRPAAVQRLSAADRQHRDLAGRHARHR